MMAEDTIAAITTPLGMGGVAVIRISGAQARTIAEKITGQTPPARRAVVRSFRAATGEVIDSGLVLYFPAPHSFTGEDVIELQGHGGIAVSQSVLQSCLQAGARLAKGGEFSQRAFLNDKIDLAQAEAIADLISARSDAAVKAAARSLQGEFSRQVNQLADEILALRVYIEAALDFPEEEIDFLSEGDIEQRLLAWGGRLEQLLRHSANGQLLNEGIQLVLAGKPNAGKSSLLNALVGEERAIVTPQAGTTRDIVRENIVICGVPVTILDTAGLRTSDDIVEREGIKRTQAALQQADVILLLLDGTQPAERAEALALIAERPATTPLLIVHNKSDLVTPPIQTGEMWISARTGAGLDDLRTAIFHLVGGQQRDETPFIARARHVQALQNAEQHYRAALAQLQGFRAGELVAEDLRLVHQALGQITGQISSDDLLGQIFSSFCIGK